MKRDSLTGFACATALAFGLLVSGSAYAAAGKAGGGGSAPTHMSTQGMSNSNGKAATDRDKGDKRSDDRQSAKGATHGKK